MQRWDRRLSIIAIATILAAWIVGSQRAAPNIESQLRQALPGAQRFVERGAGVFEGVPQQPSEMAQVGCVAIGSSGGYGGPMQVAVGVETSGNVVGLEVLKHHETAAYFKRVMGAGAKDDLIGKSYLDSFIVGQDVDAVTGATATLQALAGAVQMSAREVAGRQLGLAVPPPPSTRIEIGMLEITLASLFGIALLNHLIRFRRKKLLRWASLIVSLLIVGFVYNAPITLTHVNSLLLGYWPQWQSHVHWYLLITGVLLVPLLTGRNPYCRSVCPFGAAQHCLGAIGMSKRRIAPKYRAKIRWLPRILAWAAILMALMSDNPAMGNYEVYGGLFQLIGTPIQFALLALVLIASLVVTRPWCNFLCPIGAVTDFLRFFHWQSRRRTASVHPNED